MVKFIHTSDFQLGMTRWFLEGEAQARFNDDRMESVVRLGELARETGAEFIVVAGDVFEHNALSKNTLSRAKETFRNLPVPVYLLPGNHDPLVADSVLRKPFADNVHVIADFAPIEFRPGVEIVGAPYLTKRANYDLVREALAPLEPYDGVRIAVGHGQVEARDSEADVIDLRFVEEQIEAGVIDYLALGDTHSTQELGSSGRVRFSGSPETTAFDDRERDSGNALIVTVDGGEVDVVKHRVGRWHFRALEADVNSMEDVERFLKEVDELPYKRRTAVKYGLRGTVGLEAQARLEQGLADLEPVFASLRPRERTMDLHLAPSEEELANLDLHGFAADALADLVGNLHDPVARDAANLLFRLTAKEA
ncbi:exonuclease SbcCD subunit D [Corynebacterium striatum]|uniref:metallophosphoesterase family protein n=1 Tax=Corynebacterium striatum TaxID=43770 RepID=UPI00254F841F|nr:exonuclease SbcCD subunit D [Corynebacterium striatum]MDK8843407.1 exonuclease SbcCD subunit D [Corynebacterium striatum]